MNKPIEEKKEEEKPKLGRPSKYKEEYCEQIIEYFNVKLVDVLTVESVDKRGKKVTASEVVASDLPLFQGFAHEIDVHVDTLHEWKKAHASFSEAYKKAQQLQHRHLITNGLQGRFSTAFSIFTAKNIIGWRDKAETEISIDQDSKLVIEISK